MITHRTPNVHTRGAKSSNNILELGVVSLFVPHDHSLLAAQIVGPTIQTNILQHARMYIEMVEAKDILCQVIRY